MSHEIWYCRKCSVSHAMNEVRCFHCGEPRPGVPPSKAVPTAEEEAEEWISSIVRGIRLDNEAQARLLGMTPEDFESADDLVIVKKLLLAGALWGMRRGAERERGRFREALDLAHDVLKNIIPSSPATAGKIMAAKIRVEEARALLGLEAGEGK